ncbi:Asp-tRNA(Asn)/Glu-tRNA(Gln) amidotransferase subunit GatB [uncultured Tyzzerella sp.]|uniref:Asp-tRNA(Asn)/Glu-tRNA(Gln) amidotransferase subunit GatB n=1 Tax=uncultured Tyzzerella sp. TaxID=2321398 RepID=UPI0029422677|nr:Asp-tRNA(Asn)/Glu-tRNA(Gln) amidotransferase subunit GatB [uncultured Tyzzerella sp.]
MDYKVNIGLEVHIELLTKNKMFCMCKSRFGDEENKNVCPICLALPGALPTPNKDAISLAIKTGIATNCKIDNKVLFDRKNYFYKDLPKGYQITQFYKPICTNGYINLENKKITIKEIHMEEDAGKIGKNNTIDYNRAGVPLLELVTMPDFENADEVIEFLKLLREILVFCNISDCKIQEGSMRVDINLSVRKENMPLGNRVEIKNVGSFKSIKKAINYEIKRHINLLEKGNSINIETRKFDENNNITVFMRNKETIEDYCYLKDPDIPPINLSEKFINSILNTMPMLPKEKREIYKQQYNLSQNNIDIILSSIKINNLFEDLINQNNPPKEVSNLICGELFKIINEHSLDISNINFNIKYISTLINIFLNNKISRDTYKSVFFEIIINNTNPIFFIEKNNLYLITDTNFIENIIIDIINKNPNSVNDYKNGKEKAFKYLVGQCMKAFKGKCNNNIINEILLKYIN